MVQIWLGDKVDSHGHSLSIEELFSKELQHVHFVHDWSFL